jgi:predicted transposase
MKVTTKAMLINVSEDDTKIIDDLMTVFCSAIRYSFKRILENMRTGDIEKATAHKYGLNIRQSKDAVENARQTIVSQKQLLKMNYENYLKKATAIERILNDEKKILCDKKRFYVIKKDLH